MKLTINSTETLEAIYSQKVLPPVLQKILEQKTYQERVETKFITSMRARNNFSDWGAALSAINPIAVLTDDKKILFTSLLNNGTGSINVLKGIQIDLEKSDLLAYEKVSNTPAEQPVVSVIVYIKFKGKKIDQFRIAATGVSKSANDIVDFSQATAGKTLDIALVKTISEEFINKIDPVSTYMGSADYRRNMAGVLIERILSKKINGEM